MYVINKKAHIVGTKRQNSATMLWCWIEKRKKRKKKNEASTIYWEEIEKILFVILHSTWLISLRDVARRYLISFVVVQASVICNAFTSIHMYEYEPCSCRLRIQNFPMVAVDKARAESNWSSDECMSTHTHAHRTPHTHKIPWRSKNGMENQPIHSPNWMWNVAQLRGRRVNEKTLLLFLWINYAWMRAPVCMRDVHALLYLPSDAFLIWIFEQNWKITWPIAIGLISKIDQRFIFLSVVFSACSEYFVVVLCFG